MEKKILPRKIINITKIIIFVYILQLLLSLILYYRSIEKYEIDEIKISIEKETPWYLSIIPGLGIYEKGECDQPIIGMPRRGMRILPL